MLLVGIDEAGYGPRLGPLCVASAALRIDSARPGLLEATGSLAADPPLDVWHALRSCVGRGPSRDPRHVLSVCDSKLLKGAQGDGPFGAIERGVLAFTAAAGASTASHQQMFAALGCTTDGTDDLSARGLDALPRRADVSQVTVATGALCSACQSAGLTPLTPGCRVLGPRAFNERCAARVSKASVSFGLVADLLRSALALRRDGEPAFVAIDRQGGRIRYADVLSDALPGFRVRTIAECPERSVYALEGERGMPCRVVFQVRAESAHFCVALASMVAKYVRELSMERFNAYWSARIPELKPTAGYAMDAGRWIADVRPHVTEGELASIVRRL